jgi:tRNA dimethylallyltransferase
MEREVIVVTGPTASGKTSLSIQLALGLNTEIISADSRQFYKLLDIGTAKPSVEELSQVKHHFISFLDPAEDYNVSRFRKDAIIICERLWKKGKMPVISGGSGLYIKALIDGLSSTPDPDPELRQNLMDLKVRYGNEYLHDKLKEVDSVSAENMLPQNWKRVIRALEVYYLTGKTLTYHHKHPQESSEKIVSHQFGILPDREILYERINRRTDEMIRRGLIEEVRHIMDMGYKTSLNSLNTVGYKEIAAYLNGETTLVNAVELIKRNTRRYAKRQMTWFRKDNRIEWESINTTEELFIFAGRLVKLFS